MFKCICYISYIMAPSPCLATIKYLSKLPQRVSFRKVITSVKSRVIILHFFSFRKLATWIWYRADSIHGLKLTSRVVSSRLLPWILGSHKLPGSSAEISKFLNCQIFQQSTHVYMTQRENFLPVFIHGIVLFIRESLQSARKTISD